MGRGVSCGGGKSSLGYLFGGGAQAVATPSPDRTTHSASSIPVDKQLPAGIPSRKNVVDKEISAEGNNHSRCPKDATASASNPISAEGNNHTRCLNDATASASNPISAEGNNHTCCPNDATASAPNPISAEGNNHKQCPNDATACAANPISAESNNHKRCPNDATASASNPIDKNIPAGIHSNPTNNYLRIEGQNCGNFITDRPFTKVHAAPGGGSSLGYLFGGN